MEEIIKEGTWKCPNCGNGNRGRDVKCSGCGQSREGVDFQYDESSAAVTDAESLALAEGGADWICGYCGTSNRAAQKKCKQCAAEAGEGKNREVTDVPEVPVVPPPVRPAEAGSGMATKLFGALFLFLLIAGFLSTRRSAGELLVQSASWSRAIEIERQVPETQSGWNLPSGARELYRRTEIHHYNKLPVGTRQVRQTYSERVQTGTTKKKTGTKNLGNGYFKETWTDVPVYENRPKERWVTETVYRDDPVWAPKIYYEILVWKTSRTERSSGNDTSPKWPDVNLAAGDRQGKRVEVYSLELKDPSRGKAYTFAPSGSTFVTLKVGQPCRAEFNGLGTLLNVSAVASGQ